VDPYGFLRFLWVPKDSYGVVKIPMDSDGFLWIPKDS
jgi:hypothetical protein